MRRSATGSLCSLARASTLRWDGAGRVAGDYEDHLYTTPICSVINRRLLDTPPTMGAGFTCVQHPVDVSDWYDPSDMAENYHEPMKALVSQLLADSDEFEEPMFAMTNGHLTRNEAEAEAGERLGAHHLVHK